MIWGGADEIILEISVWSLRCVQPFVAHQAPQSIEFFSGVGCHFLLQEIFPTNWLNPGLPHCGQTLYQRSHQGKKNRNRVHNKWTALETSQKLPPPLSVKRLSSKKNSRGPGRNFKCTWLSQVAGLGRCWSRGVQRGRTSLAWVPQQTSDSLGDGGRDLFHFFKYPCGINWKLSNSFTVFLIKCFLSLLNCEVPTVTITVLIYLIVLPTLWI